MIPVHPLTAEKGRDDWYAIYTRHQHEKTIAWLLSTTGLKTFLPLYDVVHQWKDRKKRLSLPLFPCYVFVQGGSECHVRALYVPGVCRIVGVRGQPSAIPDSEIQAIRTALSSSLRVEPHPFLHCGDRIRLRTGPLAGVGGILLRKKNACRLILSVSLLERSVAVEVDARWVERVAHQISCGSCLSD